MDIATRILVEAPVGVDTDLERAGSTMENPYVYDAVARTLAGRGPDGGIEVVASEVTEVDGTVLITRFRFRRLR